MQILNPKGLEASSCSCYQVVNGRAKSESARPTSSVRCCSASAADRYASPTKFPASNGDDEHRVGAHGRSLGYVATNVAHPLSFLYMIKGRYHT
jgi:hypothetical protein